MAVIRKEQGELISIAFLIRVIGDCVKFFNVGKSMNDLQLTETAKLILQEFYFLKIEDLRIFFQRFKTGHYGQLFDRLDGQVIMVKLREYCVERMSVAEDLSLDSHKELTEAEKEEKYLIKIGDNYLREEEDELIEVVLKDTATKYNFKQAVESKIMFAREYKTEAKIIHAEYSDIGLVEYLKKERPDWNLEPKKKALVRKHTIEIAQIDASDLSELDKENKKRWLAGLKPISQQEFELRNELYKN